LPALRPAASFFTCREIVHAAGFFVHARPAGRSLADAAQFRLGACGFEGFDRKQIVAVEQLDYPVERRSPALTVAAQISLPAILPIFFLLS
jgi:hypothetical protein